MNIINGIRESFKTQIHIGKVRGALQTLSGDNYHGMDKIIWAWKTHEGVHIKIKMREFSDRFIQVVVNDNIVCMYHIGVWDVVKQCERFHYGAWVDDVYYFRDQKKDEIKSQSESDFNARYEPLE